MEAVVHAVDVTKNVAAMQRSGLAAVALRHIVRLRMRHAKCRPATPRKPKARPKEKPMSGPLLFSPMTIRGRRVEEPHRGAADAPIFRDQGLSDRLASDECGKIRGRRRGACDRRVHQGGAARLRHGRRSRHLGRQVRRAAERGWSAFIQQQNSVAGIQLGHSGRKARATRPWEGDRPLRGRPRSTIGTNGRP